MAIVPHKVDGSYDEALFEFIAESEGFVPRVYSDHLGIPTLGLGYAMLTKAANWPLRPGMDADLSAIGVVLNEPDLALLRAAGRTLARGAVDEAKALIAPWQPGEDSASLNAFSFFITREQGRALFEKIRPGYEAILERKLGSELLADLAGSQELKVLFSLAYNNPDLIGRKLTAAMKEGAREKAWYEIRFGSNRNRHRGLQNRRDAEAETFGTLNANPTDAERQALRTLIEARRADMSAYLAETGRTSDEIEGVFAALEEDARRTRLA
ncbi:hypothetical protein [Pelagibius sp.]|uniref:hypothetical protein n=1 Tax=Pelagibius sp. TaxID=1931238 RepID=UPI0026208522|nr:hypothetical protein [Pelagibius sp.]